LAVIEVCDWQRAVTMMNFWPVVDQECEAVREVDHEEAVPSPQSKLYWRVCPILDDAATTVYE
jgi:hypothetical protein